MSDDFVTDNERTRFDVALQDFIVFHETNNSSPTTIANYSRILPLFVAWLFSSCNLVYVDQLRVKHLREYVAFLQKKVTRLGYPLKDTTIHHYALIVSVFCHWLEYEGLINKSVTERFELPKYDDKDIPALTYDDFNKLLIACEEGPRNRPKLRKALTARNRAIVAVLFDAGLRRSELLGLTLGDIDREMRLLHVRRKGGKWQQVPVSHDGFKALHEYITRYRPHLVSLDGGVGSKKDDLVFLTANGEPFQVDALDKLFQRLRERSGITDKPVYSHQGRRYMATTQLDAGRNPLDVQRQMGHTTLMMTNRYYSQTVDGLKRSHDLHSPLRNKKNNETRSSGLGSGYYEE